jgi:leucyl aminopeptidase (aminopeptidase T)
MHRAQRARIVRSVGLLGLALLGPGALRAQAAASSETTRRLEQLAPRIVQTFAPIKAGELVAIYGGPHLVPAMEAIAREVEKAGGHALLILVSPSVIHTYFTDVPDQYLGRPSAAWQDFQVKSIDVEIDLPAFENFQRSFADVPAERQAKVREAGVQSNADFAERQNHGKMRQLSINPPNAADAAFFHVDSALYDRITWDAIGADYEQIHAQGEALRRILERSHQVRVTTPEGTDLTFSVSGRPVIVDAGIVPQTASGLQAMRTAQLPGGAVLVAPLESSVTGKIRAASDQCDQPVKDEAIDVRNGMPENVHAGSDEACVQRSVKAAGRFGYFEIGLNPALRPAELGTSGALLPLAAGTITVDFGANTGLGGANKGNPQTGWFIVLHGATVAVDGRVIVKDGELTP